MNAAELDAADLRIELRCKNAILHRAIFDLYHSVRDFCDRGLGRPDLAGAVGALLGLKRSPYNQRTGELTSTAALLCRATGLGADELFPPGLYRDLPSNVVAVEVPHIRMRALMGRLEDESPRPDQILEQADTKAALEAALATLTTREARVIRARFGMDGEPERTLREVGADLGVNAERIRQIELKALRKLRHPSRTRLLRGAFEPPAAFTPESGPLKFANERAIARARRRHLIEYLDALDKAAARIYAGRIGDRRFWIPGSIHGMQAKTGSYTSEGA